jgi:hypothetical protein
VITKNEGSLVTHKGYWIVDKENDISIECYVTKDKGRFLSLRGTARALELKGAGSTAIARNLRSKWIQPYLSDGLIKWLDDLESDNINPLSGLRSHNITPLEAALFVDLCKAYVNAQRDSLFVDKHGSILPQFKRQNEIADKLFMLMSAFAKVGITALIDEITGYQEDRERDELTTLLALYLSEERLAWAKTFPEEFYKQIYRLKGWPYPNSNKRYRTVGKITNEIVYNKLPDRVLVELKKRNPTSPTTGRRKWTFHQFLSYDLGQPDLRNHLLQLVAIMKVSPNWRVFERFLARAFPSRSKGTQDELPGTEDSVE